MRQIKGIMVPNEAKKKEDKEFSLYGALMNKCIKIHCWECGNLFVLQYAFIVLQHRQVTMHIA